MDKKEIEEGFEEQESGLWNGFWLFVACVFVFGALFGLFVSETFFVRSPSFAKAIEIDCKNKGFWNLDANAKSDFLQADLTACEGILAKTIVKKDQNISRYGKLLESVFYTEKLYRDYNTFNFDLNVCQRFC